MLFDWLVTGHVIENESGPFCSRPALYPQVRQGVGADRRRGPCAAREYPHYQKPTNDPQATNQPYLENKGTFETAQKIAAHKSPRTTKLYERTDDQFTLDEIGKI